MHVNKIQKFILFVFIIVVVGMMIFPPFYITISGRTISLGYSFLLSPPNRGIASLDVKVLLSQWLLAVLVTAAAFALASGNKVKKGDNENKDKGDFTFYTKPKFTLENIKSSFFMKNSFLIFLQLINALIGVFFLVVAAGFIPALTWIVSPSDISPDMIVKLAIKAVAMFLLGLVFFGVRKRIKRLHKHWSETA